MHLVTVPATTLAQLFRASAESSGQEPLSPGRGPPGAGGAAIDTQMLTGDTSSGKIHDFDRVYRLAGETFLI